jgi:hypothetical protein
MEVVFGCTRTKGFQHVARRIEGQMDKALWLLSEGSCIAWLGTRNEWYGGRDTRRTVV